MTVHTELTIGNALVRLAAARGGLLDDVTSEVYLERLSRFDPFLVKRACEHWSDIPREDYQPVLPPVGALIETLEQFARDDRAELAAAKLLPAPVAEPDEKPYFCLDCHDEPYGWRSLWCRGVGQHASTSGPKDPNLGIRACARRQSHSSHTYVERCACFEVNPNSAAHRRRMAEHQQKKAMR